MYKSQSWTTSASLDILLGVIARVVAGVANIRRLARLQGRDRIRDWRVITLEPAAYTRRAFTSPETSFEVPQNKFAGTTGLRDQDSNLEPTG
jgi:hypothetical protein